MEQLQQVLSRLGGQGIEVFLDDGKLKARARKGSLDGEAVALIKAHKEALIEHLQSQAGAVGASSLSIMPGQRPAGRLPCSFAQQRLWLLDRLDGGSAHYNMPAALLVQGPFDLRAAEAALAHLIARHEPLRTVFRAEGDQPWQEIRAPAGFAIATHDLSDLSESTREERIQALMQADARRPFDLSADLMLRAAYLHCSDDEGVLLFNVHHIASDGWSMEVLLREFTLAYDALRAGQPPELEPLPIQYADYALWQRRWLTGDVVARLLGYWRQQLAALPPVHAIPLDQPRRPHQRFVGARHRFQLDAESHQALRRWAQQQQASVFMALHAALCILLSRHGASADIVIGTPVQNRLQKEVEGLIGFFVNTLVLRVDAGGNPTVGDLLERVKAANLGAQSHQDLPFEQLVEHLRPERSRQHGPLFQILFSMSSHGEAAGSAIQVGGVQFTELPPVEVSAKVDLLFDAAETDHGIELHIDYDVDLFDPARIGRMAEHLLQVLRAMPAMTETPVRCLPLLGADELRHLQRELNRTAAPFDEAASLHALFERQAARVPERLAVAGEGGALTYAELNRRANQLAHLLRARGVGRDALVGVCLPRGVDMIVALLAVLKAGGAYLPLDPGYPRARLAYMVEDSATALVLTQAALQGDVVAWMPPAHGLQVLAMDDPATRGELASQAVDNPVTPAWDGGRSLAYVIYTSGSTGRPKGVLIEHRGAVNMAAHQGRVFSADETSRVLAFASLSFDAATFEWVMALSCGASLHVCSDADRQAAPQLQAFLRSHAITHATLPPALLPQLSADGDLALACLILAGEACTETMVRPWLARCRVYNAYGPTETTVWASVAQLSADEPVSIGRPVANFQLHVLDELGQPVPQGSAGELYIGGVGLARGYLNRPELTAERFVPNPLHDAADPRSSARWYRTGDLVRHRPDGALEFLGRIDDQVKIRGHRIELGEIEAELLRQPGVAGTVVVATGSNAAQRRLVAYVAGMAEGADVTLLRVALAQALPDYMVPAQIVSLAALPLTPNGKVDRRALPDPESLPAAGLHATPATPTEHRLVALCAQLLERPVEQISMDANFFELGGHSLLVMRLLAGLQAAGFAADAQMIFGARSLRALAEAVDAASLASQPPAEAAPVDVPGALPIGTARITPEMLPLVSLTQAQIDAVVATVPDGAANVQDIYPLAPLQEGMVFFHQMHPGHDPYVMPALLALDAHLAPQAVLSALQQVIARHDALRTAIVCDGLPAPVQVVYREAPLPVAHRALDPTQEAEAQLLATFSQPQRLDLARAPLLQVELTDTAADGRRYLLIRLHHLIVDHLGLDIVRRELLAHLEGGGASLPRPRPYREFVAQACRQAALPGARAHFSRVLGDVREPTLPFGLADAQGDGSDVVELSRRLPSSLAQAVREVARARHVSAATVFHAAWALVVATCSSRADIVFGTVLSGRLQASAGAQEMLGLFINALPLRVTLAGVDAAGLIDQVELGLRDLMAFEQTPLALAQQCSGLSSQQPLFTALLNFRHTPESADQGLAAGGIAVIDAQERTNYPFVGLVDDHGDGFTLGLQLDKRVEPERVLTYLEVALARLVEALAAREPIADGGPVLAWDLLPAAERCALLERSAATMDGSAHDDLLDAMFDAQALRWPERIAVTCEGHNLTYAALRARSNRLAHALRAQGVGPDVRVGLHLGRGPELLVGLLAILKAGGAYVPLDPSYPAQRLAYLAADSGMTLLVTESTRREGAAVLCPGAAVLCVDDPSFGESAAGPQAEHPPAVPGRRPQDMAYVIYTSGSTGQPKGVMVEHRHVTRLFAACERHFSFGPEDVWTLFHAYGFDFSVWEIWGAWLHGGRLVVVPHWVVLSAHDFHALLERESVTVLSQTPRAFGMLIAADAERRRPLALRYVVFGGEALSLAMLRPWVLAHGDDQPQLVNMYGITETTVHVTYRRLRRAEIEQPGSASLIGDALGHLSLQVRTPGGALAPAGVVGELYVGGGSLARGYLGRPALTAERFVANRYRLETRVPGSERLYRTGDLVRIGAGGSLEYVGRADEQVKIRGFRIELGEIENQLLQLPGVEAAAVLARSQPAGEQRLVAYVARSGAAPALSDAQAQAELRAGLAQRLPDYMLPAVFVFLPALPLTANGKIDRQALPEPLQTGVAETAAEPQGATERLLAQLWADVLGLPASAVSRSSNFFTLGGHSLLVMRLLAQLREAGLPADVRTLYESPTLTALAQRLEAGRGAVAVEEEGRASGIPTGATQIEPGMLDLVQLSEEEIERIVERVPGGAANVQDIYPLAPLQEGIYFL
ncbi:MAG: amino acid adenylation domain-containing protein, partial [Pelomonas sp.]|nr:amino acid adenylation domain-containing protein [Roseateles sp.]